MASDFTRSLKNFLVSPFRIHCLIFLVLLGVLISSIAIPVYADHKSDIMSIYPSKKEGMWKYNYWVKNNGPDDIIQIWIGRTKDAEVINVLEKEGWEFDDTTNSTKFGWICTNKSKSITKNFTFVFYVNSTKHPSRFLAETKDTKGGKHSHEVWAPDTANDTDGGLWVPVDKFGLLTPYISAASIILATTVATAIYSKRVKRRKEKQ